MKTKIRKKHFKMSPKHAQSERRLKCCWMSPQGKLGGIKQRDIWEDKTESENGAEV